MVKKKVSEEETFDASWKAPISLDLLPIFCRGKYNKSPAQKTITKKKAVGKG